MNDPANIRQPERLREYRLGRSVDPGDPFVMHEGHPVYRVEETAEWNLQAKSSAPSTHPVPKHAAASPSPQNDAAVAELNKQRAATRAFTEQTATLNQRLTELAKAVAQTQEVAIQNLQLKQEMTALRGRLDTLSAQAHSRDASSPASAPTTAKDDKW